MKRLARILGVVGGIGAVLWAMRDRLLSVAIPREPEPPAFRSPSPPSNTAEAPPADHQPDITSVTGIGPVYATRLEEAGVSTLADLAEGRAEQVAAAAEVPLSRAVGWIDQARALRADS